MRVRVIRETRIFRLKVKRVSRVTGVVFQDFRHLLVVLGLEVDPAHPLPLLVHSRVAHVRRRGVEPGGYDEQLRVKRPADKGGWFAGRVMLSCYPVTEIL